MVSSVNKCITLTLNPVVSCCVYSSKTHSHTTRHVLFFIHNGCRTWGFFLKFPAALLTVSVTLCQMGSESRPHSLWWRSPQSFSYWLLTLHKKFRADLTSVLKLNVCHVIHPPFNLQKAIAKKVAIVFWHPTMHINVYVWIMMLPCPIKKLSHILLLLLLCNTKILWT